MGKESINIDAIIAYLTTQPVLKMWLFGSYATGEANSDRMWTCSLRTIVTLVWVC